MKYPIDVERYIAAMRMKFGPDATAEEAHRALIPVLNAAYEAGLHGRPGYPMDPAREIAAFEEYSGEPAGNAMPLLVREVQWINEAYEQGCRKAGGAVT